MVIVRCLCAFVVRPTVLAALLFLLFTCGNSSPTAAAEARLRLDVTAADGSPLPMANGVPLVNVGQEFWLTSNLTDLRPAPEGIFASFADVVYDPAAVSDLPTSLEYDVSYSNFTNSDESIFATSGLLDEVGSGGGVDLPPMPGEEKLQWRIQMRAESIGATRIELNPAENLPRHDVLLWMMNEPLSQDKIEYQGVAITVVPEPASAMLFGIALLALLTGRRLHCRV